MYKILLMLLILATPTFADWDESADEWYPQVANHCIQLNAYSNDISLVGAKLAVSPSPDFSQSALESDNVLFSRPSWPNSKNASGRICGFASNTKYYIQLISNKGPYTCSKDSVGDFLQPNDISGVENTPLFSCKAGEPLQVTTPDFGSGVARPVIPTPSVDYMKAFFIDETQDNVHVNTLECVNGIVDIHEPLRLAMREYENNPNDWYIIKAPKYCREDTKEDIDLPYFADDFEIGEGRIVLKTDLAEEETPSPYTSIDPSYKEKLFKMRINSPIGFGGVFSRRWHKEGWESGSIKALIFMHIDWEIAEPASLEETFNIVEVISDTTLRVDRPFPVGWHRTLKIKIQCEVDDGGWTGVFTPAMMNQGGTTIRFNNPRLGTVCTNGTVKIRPTGWDILSVSKDGLITTNMTHDYINFPEIDVLSVEPEGNNTKVTLAKDINSYYGYYNNEVVRLTNTGTNLDGKFVPVRRLDEPNVVLLKHTLDIASYNPSMTIRKYKPFSIDFGTNRNISDSYIGEAIDDNHIQILSDNFIGEESIGGYGSFSPNVTGVMFGGLATNKNTDIYFLQCIITPGSFPLNSRYTTGTSRNNYVVYGSYFDTLEYWTALNPVTKRPDFNISNTGNLIWSQTSSTGEFHFVKNIVNGIHGITIAGDNTGPQGKGVQTEKHYVNQNLFVFYPIWIGSQDGRVRGHRHNGYEAKQAYIVQYLANISMYGVQDQAGTLGPAIVFKNLGDVNINGVDQFGMFSVRGNFIWDNPEGISVYEDVTNRHSSIPDAMEFTDNMFFLNYWNRIQSPVNQAGGTNGGFHGSLLKVWGSFSNITVRNNEVIAHTAKGLTSGRLLSLGGGLKYGMIFTDNIFPQHGGNYNYQTYDSDYTNFICPNDIPGLLCDVIKLNNEFDRVPDPNSKWDGNVVISGCKTPEKKTNDYVACLNSEQLSSTYLTNYYKDLPGENDLIHRETPNMAFDVVYEDDTLVKRPEYANKGMRNMKRWLATTGKIDIRKVDNEIYFEYEAPLDYTGNHVPCKLTIGDNISVTNPHTMLLDDGPNMRSVRYDPPSETSIEYWKLSCGRYTNFGALAF